MPPKLLENCNLCNLPNMKLLIRLCLELLQVTLVELSRPSSTLPELLSGIGSSIVGVDQTLRELLQGLASADGVQARMDGIMFQGSENTSHGNAFMSLIKDYLSSI